MSREGKTMPYPQFDRSQLRFRPLAERQNKVRAECDLVALDASPQLSPRASEVLQETVKRIRTARERGKPVILAFGAHSIKNGLGPVLIELIRRGWIQHLATNGAGIIHDWELAFQGETSENVERNTAQGQFGIWAETGFNINLALVLGAVDGLGYGESVGRLIATENHQIPTPDALLKTISAAASSAADASRAAAAADLLACIRQHELTPGTSHVPHPWKTISVQAAAYEAGVPFTGHPMFGHDIIYTHPLNHGAAIGRSAERDFLAFAKRIAEIEGGVYLSVGSAVMSPMIFEKSLSMAQNIAIQNGTHIDNHTIVVVDLAENRWDWNQGEPPQNRPEYYLRYCKTFSRMGGTMHYATADNRDFLLALMQALGTP
jgi:hypothetical protein